jgi:hypothetical protein
MDTGQSLNVNQLTKSQFLWLQKTLWAVLTPDAHLCHLPEPSFKDFDPRGLEVGEPGHPHSYQKLPR